MMSSQAKHVEKILAIRKWGRQEMTGGRSAAPAGRGAVHPQPCHVAARTHPLAGGEHCAGCCGSYAVWLAWVQQGIMPLPLASEPPARPDTGAAAAPKPFSSSQHHRAGPAPAPQRRGEDGAQRHRDGCTERWPSGPSKATCKPVRSSLSASHQSARRLINFLFVFRSFIFKLQSSLLSNKYSTIKAFFSPTCDSNISVSHPPVTFPAINRFVKTAFDAPAAISHLKSHNYHPIMGLLTSSKNKAIEYGNLFVN